jgi:hypothetical protein
LCNTLHAKRLLARRTEKIGHVVTDPISGISFDGDEEDLNLEGDASALRALAQAVIPGACIQVGKSPQGDRIEVTGSDNKLTVGLRDSALTIDGDEPSLREFAGLLHDVARGPDEPRQVQHHEHVDPTPDRPWVRTGGASLTVWLRPD